MFGQDVENFESGRNYFRADSVAGDGRYPVFAHCISSAGWDALWTCYAERGRSEGGPSDSPVCRYYIPPGLGDSLFFGRGTVECNATGQKNPSFVLDDPAFMHMVLPAAGVCPANTLNVYRVLSNRPEANHRYMTDRATRDVMLAKGRLAEGDGPDLVVMCAPF